MGEHEGWAQPPSGLLPNGLLPDEAATVMRMLDSERWSKAEERTAELIACIQPNPPSEERRNAVADYVQRLIMKCFPCQVFTFGSVPLKTYLPDGDIDLTAFSKNQNLKETWAHQVRDMLESEEKNENAEFRVKEVQYIKAEVKIIKCLVENIVVDISFDQLGGLCTLCFLEEVDHLINQNHLFKRSIILIKAWCYYESRILGAHHGLISTYALETLVLYIFHVFNNSFAGPLEVLYRFLEFFSKFDWDNFCVSLWGPVPISSLPDVTAEPPRKDGGELLLSKLFLEACSAVYAVFPGGQENQGQPFVSKHFNVIDPLRVNNNLGRSVSKGNFFRIRSAFAFGAKRLARLFECPREDILVELNQFFLNTWERHGSGQRPDVPKTDLKYLRLSNSEHLHGPENLRHKTNSKRNENPSVRETQDVGALGSHTVNSVQGNSPLESAFRNDTTTTSRNQAQRSSGSSNNSRSSDHSRKETNYNHSNLIDRSQRYPKPENHVNDVQGRFLFARTRSSPELTDTYSEVSSPSRRNRVPESGKAPSNRTDANRRKNLESDNVETHLRSSTDEPSIARHIPTRQSIDATGDSNSGSNSYQDESGPGTVGEDFASISGTLAMHQEEQDLVNLMASSTAHNFSGQVHLPLNLTTGHLPLPLPSSVLAPMGYAPRNLGGMLPTNIPLIEAPWGTNMHFPQGFVPSPLTHYFPGMGLATSSEDGVESGNENFSSVEMNSREGDQDFWHEQDRNSAVGFDHDNGGFEGPLLDDKQQSTSGGFNFSPSSRMSVSGSTSVAHKKHTKENRVAMKDGNANAYQDERENETCYDDRPSSFRPSTGVAHSSGLRNKIATESSWDELSSRASKSSREKRGWKSNTFDLPSHGKGKNVSEHSSTVTDEDSRDWNHVSTAVAELTEVSGGPQSLVSMHATRNQITGLEPPHTAGSDPLIPLAPVLLGPGSRQRPVDSSSGVVPFAFYPTGPPVPFVTMLPVYNFPSETGTSDASTSHFSEDSLDNADSSQSTDLSEAHNKSDVLTLTNPIRGPSFVESLEPKPDILNSDFASHWQNLQYGRFCQNSRHPSPVIYPSPVVVPPVYLQGRFPWDGPGRPLSTNMNLFTLGYGSRLVPVAPLQSVSNRPNIYQHYIDEMPRHRSGTGTYLPNPASARERQNARRGNFSYERSDSHGERDGNWNVTSKSRTSGRRGQVDKPNSRLDRLSASENRVERAWSSHRHDSLPYQSQNGPIRSNSTQSGSTSMAYGMYPLPSMNPGVVSSNGPSMPSVVMLYPLDHNGSYASPAEQLEFGSLGPVGFANLNDVSQVNEGGRMSRAFEDQRFHGSSNQRTPLEEPPSPHLQR
ncbi:Poly(A) RNA polymerase cid14 [Cucumis melo var. makuwa]|uniref:Poly(A) RNA polymerase cid14 n=1 Tax=Cucumis melo var. makuwa TaxID=1194695 RepID=A0A5A7UBT6_CUCMM|nr:Poly(A) RNA polymerase cid14 [Cucumis melo var. makuwa]